MGFHKQNLIFYSSPRTEDAFYGFGVTGKAEELLYPGSEGGKTKHLPTIAIVAIIAAVLNTLLYTNSAQAQGWPDVFDTNQLLTLNIKMMIPEDWDTIRYDRTFSIEVPAWFWADGEEADKKYVSVRRKSCDAIPNETDPCKISLKIDVNKYVSGQQWHALKKLSLENGDDQNVLAEGIAANIHRMACVREGYGYDAWRASWVKLYVNGVYRGVYINAEQYDKRFLQNRGLYVKHRTWLYRYSGFENFKLDVGDDLNPKSPTVDALCYKPFVIKFPSSQLYPTGGSCPTPDDVTLVNNLNGLINMQGMLTYAVVNALISNPDGLFSHGGHNVFFLDFDDGSGRKRMYFPWDVDAALSNVNSNIYERKPGQPTTYQDVILGNPLFRCRYNRITRNLLNGSLSEANIHSFINSVETQALIDALEADPWSKMEGGVANRFQTIRDWFSARIVNVLAQVAHDEPSTPLQIYDLNIDGAIDWNDVVIMFGNWLKAGPDIPGDFNNDQIVNFRDVAEFVLVWQVQ